MDKQNNHGAAELKRAFILDTELTDSPAEQDVETLSPAQQLAAEVEWQAAPEPAPTDDPGRRQGKLGAKWFWLLLALLGLGTLELALFIRQVVVEQDWLSGAWLLVLAFVFALTLKELYRQWRGTAHLKRFEQLQQQAKLLLDAPSMGQGQPFCEKVLSSMHNAPTGSVEQWRDSIQPHHVDREVLQLFERQVLSDVDQQAVSIMTRHASASAAMIAVSPFALLDMLVVLWRNLVMLKQISQCYGIRLGYWGRIGLVKRVFKTMLFAGASEIISDAGNYALGAGVTGKLSTRLAQGLGAGVLTARVGVKAMHACRPLPFVANKPPGLSKFSQQLLKDLKNITT